MNAKSEAMYLSYGDPKTVERLMETARNYGRIIETNSKGHTHVVSSYYSGTDVSNATVSLKSSLPHAGSDLRAPAPEAAAVSQHPVPLDPESAWENKQPTFKGLTLHFNEHKFVAPIEATFTVPAREYEQWMKGMRPNFVIEFQDAAGKTLRMPIQLTRMP